MVSPLRTSNWLVVAPPPTSVRKPSNNPGCVVSYSVTAVLLVRELATKLAVAWPVPARSESPTSTVTTALVV